MSCRAAAPSRFFCICDQLDAVPVSQATEHLLGIRLALECLSIVSSLSRSFFSPSLVRSPRSLSKRFQRLAHTNDCVIAWNDRTGCLATKHHHEDIQSHARFNGTAYFCAKARAQWNRLISPANRFRSIDT